MIALTNQKKVVEGMDILDAMRFHDIYSDRPSPVNGTVVQEAGKHGSGEMRCFQIAPGVQITYNDLSMDSCFRPIRFEKEIRKTLSKLGHERNKKIYMLLYE